MPAITSIRSAPDLIRTSFTAFGTFGVLLVTKQSAAVCAARNILAAELRAIDRACSRFRADSELTAVNRADGTERPVSPLFAEALAVALRAAEASDGDVDPTCGRSLVGLGYDRDFAELAGREQAPRHCRRRRRHGAASELDEQASGPFACRPECSWISARPLRRSPPTGRPGDRGCDRRRRAGEPRR